MFWPIPVVAGRATPAHFTSENNASWLFRTIVTEGGIALVELRLHAAAVTAEARHVGAARFRGERQRLDFRAGAHRGPRAHDLHGTMHRALVELLQLDRHLGGALGKVERALLALIK